MVFEQLEDSVHVGGTGAKDLCKLRIGHHRRVRPEARPGNLPGKSRVLEEIAIAGRTRDQLGVIGNAVDLDRNSRAVLALESRIELVPVAEAGRIDLLNDVALDGDRHLPGRHQQRVVGRRLGARHHLGQLVLGESGRDRKLIARLRDDRCQHFAIGVLPVAGKCCGDERPAGARGRMMMRWPTLRPRRSTRTDVC